jgi:hypothetical protein
LREDPEVTAKFEKQSESMARLARFETPGAELSLDGVGSLERELKQNPENMSAREKLLDFYRWTGKNAQPWNENVAARRRHALWLVEHHRRVFW